MNGRPPVVTLSLLALTTLASEAQPQRPATIIADPSQRVAEGFDVHRALLWASPNFQPMRDPEWRPLGEALRSRAVSDDTPLLVFDAGAETLALVTGQMAHHHVAQGERAGEPWMVTF